MCSFTRRITLQLAPFEIFCYSDSLVNEVAKLEYELTTIFGNYALNRSNDTEALADFVDERSIHGSIHNIASASPPT